MRIRAQVQRTDSTICVATNPPYYIVISILAGAGASVYSNG